MEFFTTYPSIYLGKMTLIYWKNIISAIPTLSKKSNQRTNKYLVLTSFNATLFWACGQSITLISFPFHCSVTKDDNKSEDTSLPSQVNAVKTSNKVYDINKVENCTYGTNFESYK